MNKKRFEQIFLRITLEVDFQKLVKVKAYTRVVNGKKVKVKAHYRRS